MTKLNDKIQEVTDRIKKRSLSSRHKYLEKIKKYKNNKPNRTALACGNLAHGFAACPKMEKELLASDKAKNFAIISAYNDMLSAHAPYADYPKIIKDEVKKYGIVAQFAGGVPAMCDGITQGQDGMEISLFSREAVAMSTAIALSHNMFDGVFCLGICDKIVPGLLIGTICFGNLPTIFIPAGPMPSGLPNKEKAKIRQLYAEGKISRKELLEAESKSYHSQGTCTFYGTANSNQMILEFMGLQLPSSSFINPKTKLREKLTRYAVKHMASKKPLAIADIIDEKSIVNAIVGIVATGGSTNQTLHVPAFAAAAGIKVTWQDIADISDIVPQLTKIYPNGEADINHFHAAGGTAFLIRELMEAGFIHSNAKNILGTDMLEYTNEPFLDNSAEIEFKPATKKSLDKNILRPVQSPFSASGGIKLLEGNLGKAIIKISAVKKEHRYIKAPAVVFNSQNELEDAFKKGELNSDFIAVIRFQGPKANGMPELHKLTPILGILQDRGQKVALITDGRMSGASGKIPAAIHLSPEALDGGNIAKVKNGDIIKLDAENGTLSLLVADNELKIRKAYKLKNNNIHGMGRELFAPFRKMVSSSDTGATIFNFDEE